MYALRQHFIIQGAAFHDLFSYIADNLIHLEIDVGRPIQRTIPVVKARDSAHDLHAHEFQLRADGAQVL